MKKYTLGPSEVPLYQGCATEAECGVCELLLTNLNLVLILGSEDAFTTQVHPVENIKCYKDKPQIFLKKRRVEILLTTGEMTLEFRNWLEAHKFTEAAMELLTGKSKLARDAGKVKKALDDVNEAFGVNVLEEAKNFSVDTITQIVSNAKPSIFKLFSKKKKKDTKKLSK